MRRQLRSMLVLGWAVVAWTGAVGLQAERVPMRQSGAEAEFIPPCQGPVWWAESDATYEDFDFWVGEWQIHDRITGVLLGFDEIEKIHEGCAIRQNWRQMNDRFALPGAPWRYAGGSVTALGVDGHWQQRWVDNGGGNLPMIGGFDENGEMVLESRWLTYQTPDGLEISNKYRWHWAPQEDGTILNWGFLQQKIGGGGGTDGWLQYFDIVYSPNVPDASAYTLDPDPE